MLYKSMGKTFYANSISIHGEDEIFMDFLLENPKTSKRESVVGIYCTRGFLEQLAESLLELIGEDSGKKRPMGFECMKEQDNATTDK